MSRNSWRLTVLAFAVSAVTVVSPAPEAENSKG
jgi:hypothetical protein